MPNINILDMKGGKVLPFTFEFSRLLRADRRTQIVCVLALSSFLLTTISNFSDYWLYELAPWPVPPPPPLYGGPKKTNDSEKLSQQIRSHSGLWKTCCLDGPCMGNCRLLDNLKSFRENSATMSKSGYLIGILRNSNSFPILSMALGFVGSVAFFCGICVTEKKTSYSLAAGILLVLSGLVSVLGLIIYISSNDKLSKSGDLPSYGWSFYFAGFSFIFSEVGGVMIVQSTLKDTDQDEPVEDNLPDDEWKKNEHNQPTTTASGIQCCGNRTDERYREKNPKTYFQFCRQQSILDDRNSPLSEDENTAGSSAPRPFRSTHRGDPLLLPTPLEDKTFDAGASQQTCTLRRTGGLDRIDELTSGGQDCYIASSSGINSTRQTVIADIETPGDKSMDSKTGNEANSSIGRETPRQPKVSDQLSTHTRANNLEFPQEPMFSMGKYYSLAKTRARLKSLHQSSDDTDLSSAFQTSTESIPPPMEFMTMPLPSPLLQYCGNVSSCNRTTTQGESIQSLARIDSVLPYQKVRTLHQEVTSADNKTRKKLRMPIVQKMKTFEKPKDCNISESFSMRELPLISKLDECYTTNSTADDRRSMPRTPHSLSLPCDSTSMNSQRRSSINSTRTTSAATPMTISPLLGQDEIERVRNRNSLAKLEHSLTRDEPVVRNQCFELPRENGAIRMRSNRRKQILEGHDRSEMQLMQSQTWRNSDPAAAASWYGCNSLPLMYCDHQYQPCQHPNVLLPNGVGDLHVHERADFRLMPLHQNNIRRSISSRTLNTHEKKTKVTRSQSLISVARRLANSTGASADEMGSKIKALLTGKTKQAKCCVVSDEHCSNSPMPRATPV